MIVSVLCLHSYYICWFIFRKFHGLSIINKQFAHAILTVCRWISVGHGYYQFPLCMNIVLTRIPTKYNHIVTMSDE